MFYLIVKYDYNILYSLTVNVMMSTQKQQKKP